MKRKYRDGLKRTIRIVDDMGHKIDLTWLVIEMTKYKQNTLEQMKKVGG